MQNAMDFAKKLQMLRKQRGMTQEELADKLYVSRTAISKWESGRGYPGIDSLKAIAIFFSVTVDELLSGEEIISIAEKEQKEKTRKIRNFTIGSLDIAMILLLILPFFADRSENMIRATSLIFADEIQPYLRIAYFSVILLIVCLGFLILLLRAWNRKFWLDLKYKASFAIGAMAVILFILTLQPYAAIFAFFLMVGKALVFFFRK